MFLKMALLRLAHWKRLGQTSKASRLILLLSVNSKRLTQSLPRTVPKIHFLYPGSYGSVIRADPRMGNLRYPPRRLFLYRLDGGYSNYPGLA